MTATGPTVAVTGLPSPMTTTVPTAAAPLPTTTATDRTAPGTAMTGNVIAPETTRGVENVMHSEETDASLATSSTAIIQADTRGTSPDRRRRGHKQRVQALEPMPTVELV